MPFALRFHLLSVITCLLASIASAQDIAFFEQRIRPVLIEHCYECHSAQAKKLRGNLLLDSKAGWQRGGDSGEPAIRPGDPEHSLLIRSVRHAEPDLHMPPKKPQLAASIIADLITWVKMGAPDPREGAVLEAKRGDKNWWSLQPLAKVSGSIDSLIEAKLKEKGLALNPPADARTLLRRASYDLHGLPPSVEEVERFTLPDFAKVVDHLLASPRYGERWGRHWLDVVRFGESNGFERNFIIDDLWPFRDYVIRSINDDKPFDQFVTEHLAGDVIGKGQPDIEVGSAFLVAGPYDDVGNQDVVAQKNIRAATLDDMITATSSAFLGLTTNCARCHDHKFDPIPTEDYYRLRAAFEGTTHGRRVLASTAQQQSFDAATAPLKREVAQLTRERDALNKDIDQRVRAQLAKTKFARPKISFQGTDETFAPIEARYVKFVIRALTSDFQAPAPKARKAAVTGQGRLTEFQIWSADATPRNVALASTGATAAGAKSAVAEDFPDAYGPQVCIDGERGESWFIGSPPELSIALPKPERISRITFINAKGDANTDDSKVRGAAPCEYEVQVSADGETWQTVASDEGREPWSLGHARRRFMTEADDKALATIEAQIASVQKKLDAIPPLPVRWVGTHAQPSEGTFVHQGGDPMKPLAQVMPASLQVLDRSALRYEFSANANEGERRLALAQWIVRTPLAARVLANRVWHYHFGMGLVDTPSDFGFLGSKPTHPELLDYLAQRLIDSGWRIKDLHREIMQSRTYQQSSAAKDHPGLGIDKAARLLWRFPPRRLSAEEVRDTMLTVSGKLQLEPMGGPGFRLFKVMANNVSTYAPLALHGPDTYRRAVYHQNARASVVDVLSDFDFPDISFATPKRANTTSPLQALTLLNHAFTTDMADAFAARLGAGDAVTQAYRLAYQREASAEERTSAQAFIAKQGLPAFTRALLNSNELLFIE